MQREFFPLIRMWLLGFLILFQGTLSIANGLDHMLQTLKCSRLRVNIEPHRNLMESPEKLDAMCKQQELFYGCLENVVRSLDAIGNEGLPLWLLNERLLTQELCSERSAWRKRYLDSASCINKQQMDFCTSSDFLVAMSSNASPLNRCLLREKAVNCIAVTLAMNCGIDAGNVFHYLLKMAADYDSNCESVGSEVISSCIGPQDNYTEHKVLDEVYNGLLNRVGDISDQEDAGSTRFLLLKRIGDSMVQSDEESAFDVVTGATEGNLDFESSSVISSDTSASEQAENIEYVMEEIDSLNQNKLKYSTSSEYKNSVVYKHSDGSISFYWRQSGFIPIESIICNHVNWKGEDAFKCSIKRRLEDPDCPHSESEKGSINPQEIDQEIGVELDGMQQGKKCPFRDSVVTKLDYSSTDRDEKMGNSKCGAGQDEFDYKTRYERSMEELFAELNSVNTDGLDDLEDSKPDSTLEYIKSEIEEPLVLDLPSESVVPNEESTLELVEIQSIPTEIENSKVTLDLDETLHDITDESATDEEGSSIRSTDSLSETDFVILNGLLEAVASVMSEDLSKPNTFPKHMQDEMQKLFTLESNPEILHTTDGVTLVWSEKEKSPIEGIVCGRVNECDPSVKDVFKCLITSRNEDLHPSQALPSDEGKGEAKQSATEIESNFDEYQSLPEESVLSEYLESSEDSSTLVLVTDDGTLLNVRELSQDDPSLFELQTESKENENVYIHMDTESEIGVSTEGYQIVLVDQETESSLKEETDEETGYSEVAFDSEVKTDGKLPHGTIEGIMPTSYQPHRANEDERIESNLELVTVQKVENILEKYIDTHLMDAEISEE